MRGPMIPVFAATFFLGAAAGPGFSAAAGRSIKIEGPAHVKENHTAYYTCTLTGDDGTTEDVTGSAAWSTSCWYAVFDAAGKLRATAVTSDQGCKITAAYDGLSDSVEITIDDVAKVVTRLEIDGPASVKENSSAYYRCWAYYDNGSYEDVSTMAVWTTNSWYASIDNGKLTTTPVTSNQWGKLSATFRNVSATLDITIENSEVKIVSVKITGPREIPQNSSEYYKCTVTFDDGSTEDVSYSASWALDSWYAAISSSGKLETKDVDADQWIRLNAAFRGVSASVDIKIRHVDMAVRPVSGSRGESAPAARL